jgi:hypothetical protein
MKGKLERASARVLPVALVLGLGIALSGCATAPPQPLSILDAVAGQSLNHPQSCEAVNAATVCIQTMRLSKNKSCGCVDRSAVADGNFGPGF